MYNNYDKTVTLSSCHLNTCSFTSTHCPWGLSSMSVGHVVTWPMEPGCCRKWWRNTDILYSTLSDIWSIRTRRLIYLLNCNLQYCEKSNQLHRSAFISIPFNTSIALHKIVLYLQRRKIAIQAHVSQKHVKDAPKRICLIYLFHKSK